ncbi:hypothetical protein A0U40_12460 [[Bacillus] sp. KCTC 13219]|nr:hypothetical protein A0U40_12460 [[Bacillus] sp. KCTC 13219]
MASVQTSNIDIWDYEEIHNTQINVLQAINHYLTHGERVDGVLHHIITKGFNLMQEALEFYANERNYLREYSHNSDELMESVIGHDNGDLARKALEEIM